MSGTMRALRKTAPRAGAELVDIPVPIPGEDEVLVRVHADVDLRHGSPYL